MVSQIRAIIPRKTIPISPFVITAKAAKAYATQRYKVRLMLVGNWVANKNEHKLPVKKKVRVTSIVIARVKAKTKLLVANMKLEITPCNLPYNFLLVKYMQSVVASAINALTILTAKSFTPRNLMLVACSQ